MTESPTHDTLLVRILETKGDIDLKGLNEFVSGILKAPPPGKCLPRFHPHYKPPSLRSPMSRANTFGSGGVEGVAIHIHAALSNAWSSSQDREKLPGLFQSQFITVGHAYRFLASTLKELCICILQHVPTPCECDEWANHLLCQTHRDVTQRDAYVILPPLFIYSSLNGTFQRDGCFVICHKEGPIIPVLTHSNWDDLGFLRCLYHGSDTVLNDRGGVETTLGVTCVMV